jgi:predicted metalloprotease
MKWRSNKRSTNVNDKRGASSGRGFSGGGLGGMLIPLILKL